MVKDAGQTRFGDLPFVSVSAQFVAKMMDDVLDDFGIAEHLHPSTDVTLIIAWLATSPFAVFICAYIAESNPDQLRRFASLLLGMPLWDQHWIQNYSQPILHVFVSGCSRGVSQTFPITLFMSYVSVLVTVRSFIGEPLSKPKHATTANVRTAPRAKVMFCHEKMNAESSTATLFSVV
jgi:hypothetical protein